MRSLTTIRAGMLAMLRTQGESDADFDACALAISELLSNAMRHGPPGQIVVTLDWSDDRPLLAVRDRGPGFVLRIALPDGRAEGGRGLYLISKLVGQPLVRTDVGGCTVSVLLPIRRQPSREVRITAEL